jgi:hypothetical protein
MAKAVEINDIDRFEMQSLTLTQSVLIRRLNCSFSFLGRRIKSSRKGIGEN